MNQQAYSIFSSLMLKLTLPCAIIINMNNQQIAFSLLFIILLGLSYNAVSLMIGYWSGKKNQQSLMQMINVSGYNIGCFAMPFVSGFFDATGFIVTSLFDIGNSIMCLGVNYGIASAIKDKHQHFDFQSMFIKVFHSIPVWTYFIMLILSFMSIKLPSFFPPFLETIGNANPFIAMAVIGFSLQITFKKEYLVKTGLCYETDDHRLRDRFWGRVIFPVHTLSGKVVAFGGRVLSSATKGVKVKYVNSPESEIYHKSSELYGIYFAKQAIVKQDRCFLVEGYTDVISMHQSGVENVVASSGTALTPGQIKLIHRFTNNITVLYDGDVAGIKASLRGIDMLLEEGMNIKVCLLPDGEDPDSFARKHNATEFQKFIQDNETDFIRFKTNLLLEDAGKDPIKRAELIGNLVQSISIIPEAIVRDVYIKECSQLLRVEDKLLVSEVAKRRETQAEKQAEQRNRETRKNNAARDAAQTPLPDGMQPPYPEDMPPYPMDGEIPDGGAPLPPEAAEYVSYIPQEGKEGQEFYKYERLILQMVVRYGEKVLCNVPDEEGKEIPITVTEYVVNDLKEDELAFHNPLHRQMLTEAAEHIHNEGFTAERYFLAHPDPIISKLSTELIADRYQLSKYHSKAQRLVTDEERLFELVPTLMINFKFAIISEEMKHMMYALQDPAVANDEEQCTSIMKRYSELREIKSIMAKRLGDRVVLG